MIYFKEVRVRSNQCKTLINMVKNRYSDKIKQIYVIFHVKHCLLNFLFYKNQFSLSLESY